MVPAPARPLQKDDALRVTLREKQQLQHDLRLMLAARDSLAALRDSMQQAATMAPLPA